MTRPVDQDPETVRDQIINDAMPAAERGDAAGEWLRVAESPDSSGSALWRAGLRTWRHPALARALAGNPRTPKTLLWWLARGRWDVAAKVADNPNCPLRVSRWMAWSSGWTVQAAVAASPVTSAEVLENPYR